MQYIYKILIAVVVSLPVFLYAAQSASNDAGFNPVPGALVLLGTAIILFLDSFVRNINSEKILRTGLGVILGLLTGLLLSGLLQSLGVKAGIYLSLVYILPSVLFGYTANLLPPGSFKVMSRQGGFGQDKSDNENPEKILDTSVIIDGRILDIAETHFIDGPFIIPNFVLREIQLISDSPDPIKRNRGRRGLEMLNKLQQHGSVKVKISYIDYTDTREVDAKLVKLSRETGAKLVTNDFNLNKVAELQGVEVLNLNNLTNALKPVVLPGEDIYIDVIKEGKDENQGIGYLEDGTMVVIENGGTLLGKTVKVNVTSIIQTAAGKMIFTRAAGVVDMEEQQPSAPRESGGRGRNGGKRRRGRGSGGGSGDGGDDTRDREVAQGRGGRRR